MTIFASAVILLGVAQHKLSADWDDPRELYALAASLLDENSVAPDPKAVRALEQLLLLHSETYYAELAAFHLAECYVIVEEPLRSLELLDSWRDRLRLPSTSTAELCPDLYERAQAVHMRAARAAAIMHERRDDHLAAIKLLDIALQSADIAQTQFIEQEIIRLAVAACMRERDPGSRHESMLQSVNEARQILIRFTLAEKLISARRFEDAERQLAWLSKVAANHPEGECPAWMMTVDLRRCELAVRQKAFKQADELLVECREKYAETGQCFQFEFLSARCAIASVDFPRAFAILTDIATRDSTPAPMRAKAHWMTGELHFLKQDFPLAIQAYQKAIDIDASDWQARALLQMAKCQELSGQSSAALRTYQQLRTQFSRTSAGAQAATRIAQLSGGQQVPKAGSSTPGRRE